jgi:octaprenyl-diphosphate synthase
MQLIDHPNKPITSLLQSIRDMVATDLNAVDDHMQLALISSVPLTRDITQHIFKTKGKQLRPLLVLLAAHAFANGQSLQKKHYELAIVIEFVHTATLLHDDVIDHSELRRGKKTANAIWGNAASVLVGDFLYSRAFQMLACHQHAAIMHELSETTNAIAEGEILQLMNQHDAELTEEKYFHVITQKTAKLFSSAAKIGAILENATAAHQQALSDYGLHLGIVFQMIDDLLDYETSSDITGKNIGDDLNEGKATFPLIHAIKNTDAEKSLLIKEAIKNGNLDLLPTILCALKETDAFTATRKKAQEHALLANAALSKIPASPYRQAMEDLVVFAMKRGY